jgi:uncharacterized protein YndB with AHSA1/START domain
MAAKSDFTVTTAPREIILTRTIPAPRELVFDAFTKAEHLSKWFGPRVFTATSETDPRPGGKFRITMYGPENGPQEMKGPFPMTGEYLELVRPERIVYTNNLQEHPDSWKRLIQSGMHNGQTENFLSSLVTITFDDLGGKTKLVIRTRFDSDAVRDGYLKFQMGEGWNESLDKLEEMLTRTVVVERHP